MKKIIPLLLIMILFTTACGRKMLTPEKFVDVLKKLNYEYEDRSSKLEGEDFSHTNIYIIGALDQNKVKVIFKELDSEYEAYDNYEDILTIFSGDKNIVKEKEVKKKSYNRYEGKDDKYYYVAVRYKRTFIYTYSKLEHRTFVESLISELGYK